MVGDGSALYLTVGETGNDASSYVLVELPGEDWG
jgi:hypothetical protein